MDNGYSRGDGICRDCGVDVYRECIPADSLRSHYAARRVYGDLALPGIIAAGTLGSLLGALPLYYIGRSIGDKRLYEFADNYGRWLTISCADIDRTKQWFERYGNWAVFLCRLIPGIRSLISIPAGLSHMRLAPFLLFTTMGTALWTTLLALAGYTAGAGFNQVEEYLDPISYVVFAALLVLYTMRVIGHKKRQK